MGFEQLEKYSHSVFHTIAAVYVEKFGRCKKLVERYLCA